MDYVIENEHIKAVISDAGAELQSVYGKTTKFEYLWQGNPEFWSGRAYVLFPICGRLTDGKYTYKGKEYEMKLHGFSRKTVHKAVSEKKNEITFDIKSDENTRKMYPFDFDFSVKYILNGNTLRTEMTVINTGKEDLLFSLGGHPGFNVPLAEGSEFSDHYVEFKNPKNVEKLIMSATCYYTGKNEPFALENGNKLPLKHELFDDDAIFLENMGDEVTLKTDKGDRFVNIKFSDMTHLGFWHAPKTTAPYVCIEPWHGTPAYDGKVDDFASKNEIMTLSAGKKYVSFIDITLGE